MQRNKFVPAVRHGGSVVHPYLGVLARRRRRRRRHRWLTSSELNLVTFPLPDVGRVCLGDSTV